MGTGAHNGFDCSAKSDMDLFTINNGASLELVRARVYGDNRKIVIQNDGKNTKIFEWYVKRSWEKEVRGDEYWGT